VGTTPERRPARIEIRHAKGDAIMTALTTSISQLFRTRRPVIRNPFKGDLAANEVYYVVHPLDDEPEEKRDPSALGPMHLSKGEKLSLFALRGYLVMMVLLAGYRVLGMAGVFGPHLVH
jgi:hypothetical protein